MQFSALGCEIPCETTATRGADSQTIWYKPVQKQFDIFSLINIFASNASVIRTCTAEVSS